MVSGQALKVQPKSGFRESALGRSPALDAKRASRRPGRPTWSQDGPSGGD